MGNFNLTDADLKKINEEKLAIARKEIEDRKLPAFGVPKKKVPKVEEEKTKVETPKEETYKKKKIR